MKDRNAAVLRKLERDAKHAAFMEILEVTGLKGNFGIKDFERLMGPGYNYPQGPGGYGSFQAGQHGYQGNTAYGYSVSTIANLYGDGDHHIAMQQAARMGFNAQEYGDKARAGFMALMEKDGDIRGRIATIIAERDYKIEMLKAAGNLRVSPQSKFEKKEYYHKVEPKSVPKGPPRMEVIPPDPTDPKTSSVERLPDDVFMATIVMPDCSSCHKGSTAKGGFIAADYLSLNDAAKAIVRARVHETDPKLVMPRDATDHTRPGVPQTQEKKLQWKIH